MPRKKTTKPAAVAFTMATRKASYGDDTQSNTPDPTCNPSLDSLDTSHNPSLDLGLLDSQLDVPLIVSTQPKKEKKANLIWTDIMEETLFNGLLEQDHLSKRANIGFKSKAWAIVQDAVQGVYIGGLVIEVS